MAILIPRKKDYWQRKPSIPVEIKTDIGLSRAFILDGDGVKDLVAGRDGINSGAVYSSNETADSVLSFNGTTDYVNLGTEPYHSGKLAIISGFTARSIAAYQMIVANDESVTNARDFQFRTNASTGLIEFIPFVGGVNYSAVSTTPAVVGERLVAGCNHDGTTSKVYIDGAMEGSAAVSGNLDADGGHLALGARIRNAAVTDIVDYFNSDIEFAWVFNRSLSDDEHQEYAANPYQILKPRRKYWVLPTAAAPTGFQAAWAMAANNLIGAGFN